MNRATRRESAGSGGGGGGSSTSGNGTSRGWSWNNPSNLRSLLFSPSPTKKGTPRKSGGTSKSSSRSKSTPPPKKSSSTTATTTNQPSFVIEETSSSHSSSTTTRDNSTNAVQKQRTNDNRNSGITSRHGESSSTTSSSSRTSRNRSFCRPPPPQPSSDTENSQSVEKIIPQQHQQQQQQNQQQQQKMDHNNNNTSQSSEKRRSFGEKIDGNNMVFDTSLVSMEQSSSKDTTTAYSTSESITSGGCGLQLVNSNSTIEDNNTVVTSSSDCATEVSNVSALRGWLDDFGKQQQKHYQEKMTTTCSKPLPNNNNDNLVSSAVKPPTRIKVVPSKKTKSVEVSVPPKPCHLPVKTTSTTSLSASAVKATGSFSHHHQQHHHHVLPASHYHHQPASNLSKRLEDTGLSARSRTTPIRLKPKFQDDDVKATNEGYKSVAKLSAWLADDPTKTKKVRHIRRGANVIAKSKTFDKGLADMIIEDLNIPTGLVRNQKHLLESSMMSECTDDNDEEKSFWPGDTLLSQTPSTLSLRQSESRHHDNFETSSVISVSDKKAWLQSAFKKTTGEDTPSTTTTGLRPKAKTDVITAQDQRDDVTARAKHLWRNRPAAAATNNNNNHASSSSSTCSSASRSRRCYYYQTPCAATAAAPEDDTSMLCDTSMYSHSSSVAGGEQRQGMQTSPLLSNGDNKTNQSFDVSLNNESSFVEEEEAAAELPANFQAARNLILERAKQNGCDVGVMTKVKLRQQKFEQLQKDAERRRSSLPYGRLKPSWENGGSVGGGPYPVPSTTYIKKFVEDAPPKKTLNDLP